MAHYQRLLVVGAAALSFGAAALAQTKAPDGVFATRPDGAIIHTGSGIVFPESVAGFRRTQSSVFDTSGEYVGLRYTRSFGRGEVMELRMAAVRIPETSPKEHYIITKPMALRDLSGVRVVAEGPYNRASGAQGYGGLFTAAQNGRPLMVGFWAFERGSWDLRARAEFPQRHRAEAEKAVGAFVKELQAYNSGGQNPPL